MTSAQACHGGWKTAKVITRLSRDKYLTADEARELIPKMCARYGENERTVLTYSDLTGAHFLGVVRGFSVWLIAKDYGLSIDAQDLLRRKINEAKKKGGFAVENEVLKFTLAIGGYGYGKK